MLLLSAFATFGVGLAVSTSSSSSAGSEGRQTVLLPAPPRSRPTAARLRSATEAAPRTYLRLGLMSAS